MKKRSGHSGSSSETTTTAETLSRSAASTTTTTTTTTSSDMSTSQTHRSSRNPIKYSIKAVSGAFASCFTPPEDDDHEPYVKKQGGWKQQKVPSVSSRTTAGGKKKCEVARSYNSTLEAEAGKVKLTLAQIYKATKNFSPSLKIGQGGFGTVYKGTLEDGSLVAVKRARRSDYGENLGSEFASEIKMLGQVQHLNLVKFYGFLVADDERIIVVEYVPNGTLREHLDYIHGNVLDMATRLDIAIDVAHAITYLHMYTENPIIHRDIKSSNILLTERYRAKVADFGFARLAADRDSTVTHVFTQVKGTAGYLDPEYLKTNELTVKSDVYSFGILLVELVTGRRPLDTKRVAKERVTAKWVIAKFTEGDAVSTMDPRLEVTTANSITLEKVLELAFACLAPERQDRPTMKECAEVLWTIRKEYKELSASDASDSGSLSSNSKRSQSVQEE